MNSLVTGWRKVNSLKCGLVRMLVRLGEVEEALGGKWWVERNWNGWWCMVVEIGLGLVFGCWRLCNLGMNKCVLRRKESAPINLIVVLRMGK